MCVCSDYVNPVLRGLSEMACDVSGVEIMTVMIVEGGGAVMLGPSV